MKVFRRDVFWSCPLVIRIPNSKAESPGARARIAYTIEPHGAQAVRVMKNQGEAEAQAILTQNDAFCRQYSITQGLQSEAA